MAILSEHDVFIFIAQLGIIIFAARICGEIAVRLGQPIIVGEVIAGIILGPAIFGAFAPQTHLALFPIDGPHPYLLQGISWLCVLFLLLITGLEVDFRSAIKQGRPAILISICGLIVPLVCIYAATQFLPTYLYPDGIDPLHVNLLITVALSVVAIPVIAKILFDLKIFQSEVGLKILTSGVLSDVWGWTLLAVVLALISDGNLTAATMLVPFFKMVLYLGFTLTVGQKLIDRFFNLFGFDKMDTTTALSFIFSLGLLNGAIAHMIGIHAIFGAFVAGIMAGESEKITPYLRKWTQDFIFAIFAPIFFVLIGMELTFNNLSLWVPILFLITIGSIARIGGAYIGGMLSGLGKNNALAIACGLNTQGTMGIVIALIALEMHVFDENVFSMVVIICVLTSLFVGPLLKWAIKGVRRPLAKYFDQEHVFLDVEGENKKDVIRAIVNLMEERKLISNKKQVEDAIWDRERTLTTGIGEGVALPHARIKNLSSPVLCFFKLKNPVDFSSPDNVPVQLLFLELTDRNDEGMHLNLIAQVAKFISSPTNRTRLLDCSKEEEITNILKFDETV